MFYVNVRTIRDISFFLWFRTYVSVEIGVRLATKTCFWYSQSTWGDIFEVKLKLERLFGHVSMKRDVRAWSFEL